MENVGSDTKAELGSLRVRAQKKDNVGADAGSDESLGAGTGVAWGVHGHAYTHHHPCAPPDTNTHRRRYSYTQSCAPAPGLALALVAAAREVCANAVISTLIASHTKRRKWK